VMRGCLDPGEAGRHIALQHGVWHGEVMLLVEAASEVRARLPGPVTGCPKLVCIDGLGGAGKTSLAGAIAEIAPDIQLVHGDDFYGPEERDWRSWTPSEGYEHYFDHQRLAAELLQPLRRGEPGRFQRYDWGRNALTEWVDVAPRGTVLVEGVYLLRPRLRQLWDLTVFVDVPRHLRAARLHARGENDRGWIERWMAAEDHYEQADNPAGCADLVISGAD
jgi:uridine kinase